MKLTLSILLAASVAGVAIAQSQPESILPPGFGDPAPPAPPPTTTTPSPTAPATAPASPSSQRVARSPDLSRIEDIITSEALERAAPVAVAPPVEYRDDRRRDPALAGVIWPAAIGYTGEAWGSSAGKFLSVVLRRTDGPLASRWAQIGLRNMLLKAQAVTVWLDAPVEVLAERTGRRDTRPLLRDGDRATTLARLDRERRPYYAEADIHVRSGNGAHGDVVDAIVAALNEWLAR